MTAIYDIRNLRINVIGAARSGMAAALLAAEAGAHVFLSESGAMERFIDQAGELAARGIECEFGSHSERVFQADILVVSPGIPLDASVVAEARTRGLEVVSELEFGSRFLTMPSVAVTGTNGKTTTTMLTGELFKAGGANPIIAGNIGLALCEAVRSAGGMVVHGPSAEPVTVTPAPSASVAVLEVSSYQLDLCDYFHPATAMITTITPDHLDRYHGDFDQYLASKQRIFMNQGVDDALIYNLDNPDTVRAVMPARSRLLPVSVNSIPAHGGWMEGRRLLLDLGGGREVIASIDELHLRGRHNYMNILMAALAARLHGIPADVIHDAVVAFEGVEHRLEVVRKVDQVTWINDSKATNVDSLIIALQSFKQPIVLIAGGRDKGSPYDPVLDLVREKVRAAVLIGEAADRIEQAFAGHTETIRATSMPDAVTKADTIARPGDIVLLSPACASFDMFESYEHRGLVFKKLVHALGQSRPGAGADA